MWSFAAMLIFWFAALLVMITLEARAERKKKNETVGCNICHTSAVLSDDNRKRLPNNQISFKNNNNGTNED